MTTRQTNAILLALLVAGAAALFIWQTKSAGPRKAQPPVVQVLEAAPQGTFLVATLDLTKLRSSPLLQRLKEFGAGVSKDIVQRCGFDPLDRLDAMMVAVPEDESSGEFGLAMAGRVSMDELTTCGGRVMQDRGAEIATERAGTFTLAYDKSQLAGLNRFGKLALREGGPYLLARGEWLGAMMASAEGKHPRASRHRELRDALDADRRALVVTVLLPSKLRDRLKREMAEETRDAPNAAMRGILGVEAAGVALDEQGAVVAELRCETADDCEKVQSLFLSKRDTWSKDLRLRLLGMSPLLDKLTVEAHGTSLTARTELPPAEAERLVTRLLDLRTRPPAGGTARERRPDEVLTPPKDAQKDAGISKTLPDGGPR